MIHIFRYILTRIKNQSIAKSFVSFLFLLASVISLTLLVIRSSIISDSINDIDESKLLLLIGILLLYLIIIIQIIDLVYFLVFSKEINIIAGMNVGQSIFNYKKLIDKKTKYIILVSQNFRGAMNTTFKDKVLEIIRNEGKVLLIGTTFSAMREICPETESDFLSSLEDIKDLYSSIGQEKQDRLKVIFHPSASSLTVFFRDPDHTNKRRRIAILGPKFAQDNNGPNCVFCIIEAWQQKEIFESYFGHIQYMANPRNCTTLEQFCNSIINEKKFYNDAKKNEKETIDFFIDDQNKELSKFDYFRW
ncbi:MAG: hypothetical protein GQ564_22290 [Bacteroidales bacterium]|nr:hypothetical protein [Bacteroidales bacterium]